MLINMRYANIYKFDISNGPGIRISLFTQGCNKHCPGCFNPETGDFNAGKEFNGETVSEILRLAEPEGISGLSILGGEPLYFKDIIFVTACLCQAFKKAYPDKSIWIGTGYTMEEIQEFADRDIEKHHNNDRYAAYLVLHFADVIVDGPFIEAKKDLSLQWRGSSNQRIWMKNDKGEGYDASNNFR